METFHRSIVFVLWAHAKETFLLKIKHPSTPLLPAPTSERGERKVASQFTRSLLDSNTDFTVCSKWPGWAEPCGVGFSSACSACPILQGAWRRPASGCFLGSLAWSPRSQPQLSMCVRPLLLPEVHHGRTLCTILHAFKCCRLLRKSAQQ